MVCVTWVYYSSAQANFHGDVLLLFQINIFTCVLDFESWSS